MFGLGLGWNGRKEKVPEEARRWRKEWKFHQFRREGWTGLGLLGTHFGPEFATDPTVLDFGQNEFVYPYITSLVVRLRFFSLS
jgi:hypothetical protein